MVSKHFTLVEVIAALDHSDNGIFFMTKHGVEFCSYKHLLKLVEINAAQLFKKGMRPLDRAIICLQSDLEHIVMFLSIIYLGAIPVSVKSAFIDKGHYKEYLQYVAKQQKVVFCHDPLKCFLIGYRGFSFLSDCSTDEIYEYEDVKHASCPVDIAFIQYTSGSTGSPKPVPLTHKNICSNLRIIVELDSRNENTVGCSFIPLTHDMGLIGGLLSNLFSRNSVLLSDVQFFLRYPVKCLTTAYEMNATIIPLPNFLLHYINNIMKIKSKKILIPLFSKYTTIYIGSEPISKEVIDTFVKISIEYGLNSEALFFCYGLAEATLIVMGHRYQKNILNFNSQNTETMIACVGHLLGDIEAKIVTRCDKKNVGELHIRGSSIFNGYREKIDYTKKWFNTKDLAYELNGKFYILGRNNDAIVINGRNIYVSDVENFISECSTVKECCAVFQQTNIYIFIVKNVEKSITKLELVKKMLNHFGVAPARVYQLHRSKIPRTTSGKPMRNMILENLNQYEQWRI